MESEEEDMFKRMDEFCVLFAFLMLSNEMCAAWSRINFWNLPETNGKMMRQIGLPCVKY